MVEQAAYHTAERRPVRTGSTVVLRRSAFALLVLLIIEYGVGMTVNLYVKAPAASGVGQAFGRALTQGAPALVLHVVIGLGLIVGAVVLLVRAVLSRRRGVAVAALIGLLALLGAAFNGASFVANGSDGASLGMAMLAGLALLCYGTVLYLLG